MATGSSTPGRRTGQIHAAAGWGRGGARRRNVELDLVDPVELRNRPVGIAGHLFDRPIIPRRYAEANANQALFDLDVLDEAKRDNVTGKTREFDAGKGGANLVGRKGHAEESPLASRR